MLRELAKTHPQAAALLLSATGLILTIALSLTVGVDLNSSVPLAAFVIGTGALVVVFAYILADAIMMRTLAWFVLVIFLGWVVVFMFVRPAYPRSGPVNCISFFWESCVDIADRLGEEEAIAEQPALAMQTEQPPPIPQPVAVNPARYDVFIQFGGAIRRDDIRSLMGQLAQAGWDIQGRDGGGERTGSAVGLAEIRYGRPEDKSAAEALADSLLQSGWVSQRFSTVLVSGVAENVLEVWIGRYFGVISNAMAKALNQLGYFQGPIDDTPVGLRESVARFQADNDLDPDGIIGPATTAKLLALAQPTPAQAGNE